MAQVTSSTGASSVAVLDACRALHAAVHDPPRFVQTLPVFSASLFGLDGKAWLDDPAEDAARDAVASVVGAGSEVMRVLIEARNRPVLGWPAARLPARIRAFLVPASQRPARLTPPSFVPAQVPANAPHLPLDLFLYYFFAYLTYARNHNPYPAAATAATATTALMNTFSTATNVTAGAFSSSSTSPLAALSATGSPRSWLDLYLALWRQYLSLFLGGTAVAVGGLSGRLKGPAEAFVEVVVELLIRSADTTLPSGAYVLPPVLHLQLLCLLVEALVAPPAPFLASNTSTTAAAAASLASPPSPLASFNSLASLNPLATPARAATPALTQAPYTPYTPATAPSPSRGWPMGLGGVLPSARAPQTPAPAAQTPAAPLSTAPAPPTPHPLLFSHLPRPLYDLLSGAVAHYALLPPAQLQLFVRLWRLYLLPGVAGPVQLRRAYVHHNLAFYTVLLESFLTALHSGAHSTQPDARLLDQLGAVLADLLVGVFDSAELLAALRAEEAALGPGAVPPPAPAAAVAMPRPPLFTDAARHPQRAYFVRLAALYSRERGVSAALRQAFELTDAELNAVSRAGLAPSAPPPVEPEALPNGRLTERGAEQVRLGLRKCSPLNVPASTVPQWHRPIGSREWPFLVRMLYRVALVMSRVSGVAVDDIPLRRLASTEAHFAIACGVVLLACAWWVVNGSDGY